MQLNRKDINHQRDDLFHKVSLFNTENLRIMDNIINKTNNVFNINVPRKYRKYFDLIEDGLVLEVFEAITLDSSSLTVMEKKKFISEIVSFLFSPSIFSIFLEQNLILYLIKGLMIQCESAEWEDLYDHVLSNIGQEEISKAFSILVLSGMLIQAELLVKYIDQDLSKYPTTIKTLISEKNEIALNFLLSTLKNIHFSSDEFLRYCSSLSTSFVINLIDNYNFDYNKTSPTGSCLLSLAVENKNIYLFSDLIEKYGLNINFSNDSVYSSIERSHYFEFFNILLKNTNLKAAHIERIGLYLFSDGVPEQLYRTDIYVNFFKHPSFDDHLFNLGQGYFLYGILSKLGIIAKKISPESSKPYFHILSEYLSTLKDNNYPFSPEFHIVGAGVQVAKVCESQPTTDALVLLLRKFKPYINSPNPNGILPINQVEKNSSLYQILLNNGATLPPRSSIFSFFTNAFSKSSTSNAVASPVEYTKGIEEISLSAVNIRSKLKSDFVMIKDIIDSKGFDFEIKIKCENLFLRSEKLALIIEKHSLASFTNEIHFLSENLSNYLLKSINTYNNLSAIKEESDNIDKLKQICLSHINLLTEQLELIIDNVATTIEDDALNQLNIRTKFLEKRFETEIDKSNANLKQDIVSIK